MILDQEYKVLRAVSNSTMKKFRDYGPKYYFDNYLDPMRLEPKEFSTESTDVGDLVDCLITSKASFDKYYYISGDVKCSADVKAILDKTHAQMLDILTNEPDPLTYEEALKDSSLRNIEEVKDIAVQIARSHAVKDEKGVEKIGYRNNFKDDTLAEYFVKEGKSYYQDLGVANGRKVLDMTTNLTAEKCADSMLHHDEIGKLFIAPEGCELKYQLMETAVINGTLCKILLDYALFDHTHLTIYPKDIKSALSHAQFQKNYVQFDYPNQGSFYSAVLKANYPNYRIAPFEFIVGTTQSEEDPLVYKMSETELRIAADGAKLKSGRTIVGWRKLLADIQWHDDSSQWRYPREAYEKGYITLNTYNEESIEAFGDGTDTNDVF